MIDPNFLKEFLNQLANSLGLFKAETALAVTFLAALLFDLAFKKTRNAAAVVALVGFAVTGFFLCSSSAANDTIFSNMLAVDPFGNFFKFIILITSALIVVISFFSKELYTEGRTLGEYYSLIVGMTFGMFLLVGATNLIMVYLAIETMSLSSYVLAGYTKEVRRSSEASLKYVIFGAVSSGIMIYGMSLMFGLTGSLEIADIAKVIGSMPQNNAIVVVISSLMIFSGIAYKISAVPFHFWTPDVYEGSPVTITAFLSIASKAAGFAILIRFIKLGFSTGGDAWAIIGQMDWTFIIALLSVLTMTIGNLVAVWQNNMKRLLAYSSIAHAGYMLMGVTVMTSTGVSSVLIYFFMYMLMNMGAFFFVLLIANKIGSEELEDYTGLAYRAPILCVCMVVFLISLAGLPPTAGFIGKLNVFSAVLAKDGYLWLAVVGVLNSVVSLYYYAKVMRNMFLRSSENTEKISFSLTSTIIIIALAVPNIVFGLFFDPIVNWAQKSVAMFFIQ